MDSNWDNEKEAGGLCNLKAESIELPTISVQGEKSPSLVSQISRRSSRKLSREDAMDDNDKTDNQEEIDTEEDPKSVIKRRMTMPVSKSDLRRALSEDAKMEDAAAEEFERQLKHLVEAFSARTERSKKIIAKPPTPSISDSEVELPQEEDNLLGRLRELCSPGGSDFGGESRRKSIAEKVRGSFVRKFRVLLNFLTCHYVLDADGWAYVNWLMVVAACFLYNAVVIPLRAVFPCQTKENVHIWEYFDHVADFVYAIDIIAFKSHRKFLKEGFWIKDPISTRKSYFETLQFKIDLAALFPLDIFVALTYDNYPLLRLPRLLKIDTYWELFLRFDTILASPHSARITKTLIYMIYMIHANACIYYGVSKWEGICSTSWTYCRVDEANPYTRCFYFATKTATSIGKNPRPDNNLEYLYMTFAWLSGVFVTAILIGQIRDIIATATKNTNEYRTTIQSAVSYLHRLGVPKKLQTKVKLWFTYTWEQQKTLDESKILDLLPDKMRTDVALDLFVETLSKVKLFHHCEVPFLRDLVVKLKSIIFLPGDYICRKGEVGREMFIIQSGKIHVIGGPSGTQILVTLSEGSVFGEIALLGIGGMNKRTADVRSAGFTNLFVLHKDGLEEAIRDYPASQEIMKKKAKKLMKENMKKAKEAAERELGTLGSASPDGTDSKSMYGDQVIIKTKEDPKLIEAMKRIYPPQTKIGMYLTRGSKGVNDFEVDMNKSLESLTSYPPTPYFPGSPNHISLELDISIMTGDSSEQQLSPPLPSHHPSLKEPLETCDSLSSTSSSVEELEACFDNDNVVDDDVQSFSKMVRCTTPVPQGSSTDPTSDEVMGNKSQTSQRISADMQMKLIDIEAHELADEKKKKNSVPSPSTSKKFKSREVLPVGMRTPVYPILPEVCPGASLSSSEESEDQDGAPKKTKESLDKEITRRTAAIIASRFLTAMKVRAPLNSLHSFDSQLSEETTEPAKELRGGDEKD